MKKTILLIILAIITFGITVVIIFGVPGYRMYRKAINETSIEQKVKSIEAKKNYTEYKDIPETYINAVIATEDHRFYDHRGIDLIAVARAIYNDMRAKELAEGGSTITQQLSKNIYFNLEKSGKRKIAEIFMSAKIEQEISKEKIIELYANTIYFGDGYYNIKDAAKGYFNKEPKKLKDYECIILAGIPNAPSKYSPTKNPKLTKKRAQHVVKKMVEYGYLKQEEADKIIKEITSQKW